jgi:23S rRNA (guanine745-N1)-methyltransferase
MRKSMLPLTCPVRNCCLPVERDSARIVCPKGHSFDRAKSGYFNLLQPQDRKARNPGDSKSSVDARRRALDKGTGENLLRWLIELIEPMNLVHGSAFLDVGCGDGYFAAHIASRFGLDGCGIDISTFAIDAAARRYPEHQWLVANADKRLPVADHSLQLMTSITSCKQAHEFHRLLAPTGRLIVVVSAPNDLQQLREAVHGKAVDTNRVPRMLEIFGSHFRLDRNENSQVTMRLEADTLHDLLFGTYRGARKNDQDRVANLSAMDVTLSYQILVMSPIATP